MLLGKVFLHMSRIKEKHSIKKLVMCLLHQMWAKWGVVFGGWTDINSTSSYLFSKPPLKIREFSVKFEILGKEVRHTETSANF